MKQPHVAPDTPLFMTVEEFLDWMPPAGFETHRWHLIDGEPVRMPTLDIEQGVLLGEACGVISAHLRHNESDLRVGTMVAVRSGEARHNMYVAALGATRSRAGGAKIMPNPEFLMEIRSPENSALVRLGVYMCRRAPSVEEILVLDSTAVRAWLHRRRDSREWDEPYELRGDDVLHLRSLGIEAPLSRFYHSVDIRPREQREAIQSAAAEAPPPDRTAPNPLDRPAWADYCGPYCAEFHSEDVEKLAGRIRALENKLAGVRLVVGTVNEALDRVDDAVHQFETGLAKLRDTMHAGFDRINANLNALRDAIKPAGNAD